MLFRSLTDRGKHCETGLLNMNTMSIVTCMFLCTNIYIYKYTLLQRKVITPLNFSIFADIACCVDVKNDYWHTFT